MCFVVNRRRKKQQQKTQHIRAKLCRVLLCAALRVQRCVCARECGTVLAIARGSLVHFGVFFFSLLCLHKMQTVPPNTQTHNISRTANLYFDTNKYYLPNMLYINMAHTRVLDTCRYSARTHTHTQYTLTPEWACKMLKSRNVLLIWIFNSIWCSQFSFRSCTVPYLYVCMCH